MDIGHCLLAIEPSRIMEANLCDPSTCLHCGDPMTSTHTLRSYVNGMTRRLVVACPEAFYALLDLSPTFSGRQFLTCAKCLRKLKSIRKLRSDTNLVEYRNVEAMLLQALSLLTKARNYAIPTTNLERLLKETRNDIIVHIANQWRQVRISINRYDPNPSTASATAQKLTSAKKKRTNDKRLTGRKQACNTRREGLKVQADIMLEEGDELDLPSQTLRFGLSLGARKLLPADSAPRSRTCDSNFNVKNSKQENRASKRRAEIPVEILESEIDSAGERVALCRSQINLIPTVKNSEMRVLNLNFRRDNTRYSRSQAKPMGSSKSQSLLGLRQESKSSLMARRMVEFCSIRMPTSTKIRLVLEDDISLDPDITPLKRTQVLDDHQHKPTQGSSSGLTSEPAVPPESQLVDAISSGPASTDQKASQAGDKTEAITGDISEESRNRDGVIKIEIDGVPFTISEYPEPEQDSLSLTKDLDVHNIVENGALPIPTSCYSFTLVENPVDPSNPENQGCSTWTILENSAFGCENSELNAVLMTQHASGKENLHLQSMDLLPCDAILASGTGTESHFDSNNQNQLEIPDHTDSTRAEAPENGMVHLVSVFDLQTAHDLQPTNVIESAGDLESALELETSFDVDVFPEDTTELDAIGSDSNVTCAEAEIMDFTPVNQFVAPRSECTLSGTVEVERERIPEKCPVENCTFYYCPVTEPHRLPAHKKRVHKGIKYCYSCSFCVKVFRNYIGLQTHENWHKGVYPFVCTVCSKKFLNKRQLKLHVTKYHSTEKPPLVCTFCDKKFMTLNTFRLHVRSHAVERQILCELCGLTFKGPSNFSYHRPGCRGHLNSTQYPCSKCDQTLASQTQLMRHQVKNHGLHNLDPDSVVSDPSSSDTPKFKDRPGENLKSENESQPGTNVCRTEELVPVPNPMEDFPASPKQYFNNFGSEF